MNETYEEYMNRKLLESVQYKPEEPTKITLYADGQPYQIIDLKNIDDMPEEEYNDKLKDAWLKNVHHEAVEEATIQKYMNYEVEEEKNTEEPEDDKSLGFTGEILAVAFTLLFFGSVFGILCWILVKDYGG